jgi:hypothetical protein
MFRYVPSAVAAARILAAAHSAGLILVATSPDHAQIATSAVGQPTLSAPGRLSSSEERVRVVGEGTAPIGFGWG